VKNCIRFLFIIFCFLFSLSANASELSFNAINTTTQIVINAESSFQEELFKSIENSECDIAAANSLNSEISILHDRKNSQQSGFANKICTKNKPLQQIFNQHYNKLYYNSSHKIASYLKNELHTRAP